MSILMVVVGVIALALLARCFPLRQVMLGGLGVFATMVVFAMFILVSRRNIEMTYEGGETRTLSVSESRAKYKKTEASAPSSSEKSTSRELIPTPAEGSSVTLDDDVAPVAATDASDVAGPDWLSLENSASEGDSRVVASDGPRPSQSECREKIQDEIAESVVAYADAHDLRALARRPNLLTTELLRDVVQDEYFSLSWPEFNGETQTWYTLHQLIAFDDVQSQLAQLNNRAIVDERLIITGAAAAGVLGLLGLAFVVLKTVEAKSTTSISTEVSSESHFGFRNADEAKSMGPVIAVAALIVVLIVLVVAVI